MYYNTNVVLVHIIADFGNGICAVSVRTIEKGRKGVGQGRGQGRGESGIGQGQDIGKTFGQGLEF